MTHYPAPGTSLLADLSGYSGASGGVRGIYLTSNGGLVMVCGTAVIEFNNGVLLGNLASNSGLPVSMCDNGAFLVIVDSSPNGYMAPLDAIGTAGSLQQISDPAFYGATRVDYIDTFLIFNQIGTGNFYTTTSGAVTPFDPTYAAAKEGWNDQLVTLAALHDNIWLLGNQTAEIWFNAGGSAFPFARMPNSVLQQGCAAAYSVVVADNAVYWLSQDRWGRNMMMRGEGYNAKRVSTFAVENEWSTYAALNDCIGMSYQLAGHEIVGFFFPTGNTWWAYDASTQMWHKRTYSGLADAWLPNCMAGFGSVAYVEQYANMVVAGNRLGPQLLEVGPRTYTDVGGVPITRQRSWMHNQEDGQRLAHTRFSLSFAGAPLAPDAINLDWSDDAGQTYGIPVSQTINNQTNGQYQWRRLGYARDRVYRTTWSGAGECALNGAYIDVIPHGT